MKHSQMKRCCGRAQQRERLALAQLAQHDAAQPQQLAHALAERERVDGHVVVKVVVEPVYGRERALEEEHGRLVQRLALLGLEALLALRLLLLFFG